MAITIRPTIPGGSGATFGSDATITVDGAYNGGTLADGSRYIVAPAGVKVLSSSPAPTTVSGRYMNGISDGSFYSTDAKQALDQGPSGAGNDVDGFDMAWSLDLSRVYRPGESIVKAKSRTGATTSDDRSGVLDAVTVLHVVASPPAFRAFAPYVWPSADRANKPWRVADVDGFLSGLPVLSFTGAPTWADLKPKGGDHELGLGFTASLNYQTMAVYQFEGTAGAYGRDRALHAAKIWGGIFCSEWSTADKTAAVIQRLSRGCCLAEAARGFNITLSADGGHKQFSQADVAAWMKATGQLATYDAVVALTGANVTRQYYTVTSGMFDRHTSDSLPYIARTRTVVSITGSGPYTVVVEGFASDPDGNTHFHTGNLCRVVGGVDGDEALIDTTSNPDVNGDFELTLSALPTGLTAGDSVYVKQVTPLSVGTVDWGLDGSSPRLYNPLSTATYRSVNAHGLMVAPISAMGMLSSDFDGAKAYMARVTASSKFGDSGFQRDFWEAHEATVMALPQVV